MGGKRKWRPDQEAERIHALAQANSITFLIDARAFLVRAYEEGYRDGHQSACAAQNKATKEERA